MTLYKTNIDSFEKRALKLFYPPFIVFGLLLFIPFLYFKGDKIICSIWVTIMLLIISMLLISTYKWTINQVVSLSFYDDIFEIEIMSKNITRLYSINKANINTILKWQGGRPRVLKLTLFDNEVKIADFYSGGKHKLESVLEEIAFKINKYKNPGR